MKRTLLSMALLLVMSSVVLVTAKVLGGGKIPVQTDTKYIPSLTAYPLTVMNVRLSSYLGGQDTGGMLDANDKTHAHSNVGCNFLTDDNYWEVDIQPETLEMFFFEIWGRNDGKPEQKWHDTPNLFRLVASADYGETWDEIETFDLTNVLEDENGQKWRSDLVNLGKPYSLFRFIVKKTTSGNGYFNLSHFAIYEAVEETPELALTNYLDSIDVLGNWGLDDKVTDGVDAELYDRAGLINKYVGGTGVGFYGEEEVAAFQALYQTARNILDGVSDADPVETLNALRKAQEKVEASLIPLKEGYYNVVSGSPSFKAFQDVEKAWVVNSKHENLVYYADYKPNKINYVFKITKADNGQWFIRSMGKGGFLAPGEANNKPLSLSERPTTRQNITPVGYGGKFTIDYNDRPYYCGNHKNGNYDNVEEKSLKDNKMVNANSYLYRDATDSKVAYTKWILREVTDEALLQEVAQMEEELKQKDNQAELNESLEKVLATARETYRSQRVFKDSEGLIKEVTTDMSTTQLSANCTWTGIGSDNDNYEYNKKYIEDGYNLLAALIDDDLTTYWHSAPETMDWHTSPEWLQVDLRSNTADPIGITINRRQDVYNGATRTGIMPLSFDVYGTNDETLGQNVTSNNDLWEKLGALSGIPTGKSAGVWPFHSDFLKNNKMYRYLRFVVTATEDDTKYWCMSEFQVIREVVDEDALAPYKYVEGMQEACDELYAKIQEVEEKIASGTAEVTDVEILNAAIAKVLSLTSASQEYQELKTTIEGLLATARVNEFGEVSVNFADSQDAIDNLRAVLEGAEDELSQNSTPDNIAFCTEMLKEALAEYRTHCAELTEGQWYVIKSASKRPQQTNQPIFVDVNETGAYMRCGGYLKDGVSVKEDWIRYEKNPATDPYALWRFIKVAGTEFYAIQNMATGFYMGEYQGTDPVVALGPRLRANPVPYKLGESANARLISLTAQNRENSSQVALKVDQTNLLVLTWPSDGDQQQSWYICPVEADVPIEIELEANSTSILTLPFAYENTEAMANDVKFYRLKNIVNNADETATVELAETTQVGAGEPVVAVAGSDGTVVLNQPTDVVNEGIAVNGLVGLLDKKNIRTVDQNYLGYFVDNVLKVTADASVEIPGRTGYIDATQTQALEGNTDLTLTLEGGAFGPVAVKGIAVENGSEKVNIYGIDGRLIQQGVEKSQASKQLDKGIYIIGKKKVAVK